jgi:hypothetical protein
METRQTFGPGNGNNEAGSRPHRRTRLRRRLGMAIILSAVTALGLGLFRHFEDRNQPAIPQNAPHMPIASPPVDPNRPDLIGEPGIGAQEG